MTILARTDVTPGAHARANDAVTSERPATILCSYVPALIPRSGEQIRVNALLRALSALGPVHAFVPNDRDQTIDQAGRDAITLHRSNLPWPQMSRNPWDYWRADHGLIDAVARLCRQHPVRAVVLDYGFLGQYVSPIRRLGVPVIIGTHNAQAEIVRQVPPRFLLNRCALSAAYRVERWHERHYFPAADALLCVCEEDRAYHERFVDRAKLHVVPNFIDTPVAATDTPRRRRIIMTGSFSNFQNVEGARWFLERVWTPELAEHASFCLAGRLSIEVLERLGRFPNVSALGERDDLQIEIAQSLCAVAPIRHASGTRLKCIEALSLGTPLVGTTLGVQGIDHGGAIAVADRPEAFRAALLALIDDESLRAERAEKGRAVFLREYSLDANVGRLERLFASLAA